MGEVGDVDEDAVVAADGQLTVGRPCDVVGRLGQNGEAERLEGNWPGRAQERHGGRGQPSV